MRDFSLSSSENLDEESVSFESSINFDVGRLKCILYLNFPTTLLDVVILDWFFPIRRMSVKSITCTGIILFVDPFLLVIDAFGNIPSLIKYLPF